MSHGYKWRQGDGLPSVYSDTEISHGTVAFSRRYIKKVDVGKGRTGMRSKQLSLLSLD